MNRQEFIRKALPGAGLLLTSKLAGEIPASKAGKPNAPESLGFNHLPDTKEEIMKNKVLHKAGSRGLANHGWLVSRHTFSFANYYDPDRINFGVLRVLNDDFVAAGKGFGTHPHDNMEIISIPLEGDLEHRDSMGNVAVISKGDVQVMSAGTGITHSEYNKNSDRPVNFLQIWLFPKSQHVKPRYDQITLKTEDRLNKLQQILSPDPQDAGVWIHQDAWFHMGIFDEGFETKYQIRKSGNGVYAFVLKGSFTIDGTELSERDGLGISDADAVDIKSGQAGSEILLMDIPMNI